MPELLLVDFPLWFRFLFVVPLGLILGSFLNVVIHRLPRGENIAFPGSHCPACGKPILAIDNVPILGWLVLRGKARCCQVPISARYPLVELLGGLAAAAILHLVVGQLPASTPAWRALVVFAAYLALALGLIATTFIDLEHMIVPDEITFGGAVVGLATVPLRPGAGWLDCIIGAVAGYGTIWTINAIYRAIRKHDGMGMGDAKLLMLAGAWFGMSGLLFVLFAASFQGVIISAVLSLVPGGLQDPDAVVAERHELEAAIEAADGEERAELERLRDEDLLSQEPDGSLMRARLAFGPFLALAMLEFMLLGPWIQQQYVDLFLTF